MLEILTAAEVTDLVELTTVKSHLRLNTTTEDTRLLDLIRWASSAIVSHCGRPFARAEYEETLAGTGSPDLWLSRFPIEGTPTVTLSGSAVQDFQVGDRLAGYLWRRDGWGGSYGAAGRYGRRADPTRPDRSEVVASWWAGYVLPGQDIGEFPDGLALPDDVERAALAAVIAWYREDQRDSAVTSTSTSLTRGDETNSTSISFSPPAGAKRLLPGEARDLLRGYKR